jgi:hypothetical protein
LTKKLIWAKLFRKLDLSNIVTQFYTITTSQKTPAKLKTRVRHLGGRNMVGGQAQRRKHTAHTNKIEVIGVIIRL